MFRTLSARLVTLAALSALALPLNRAQAEENAAAVYQKTLKGTVLIVAKRWRGSGWVVDTERRLIVTNYHVVHGAGGLKVFFPKFADGELRTSFDEYVDDDAGEPARVLLSDPAKDLAVIQVERLPRGVAALKLAAKSPSPGERIHAVGNPGTSGALWVYTPGNVRAVYREKANLGNDQHLDAWVVESSLPINHGDSGGPEVNDRGEVVSVSSHFNKGGRLVTEGIDVREVKSVLKDVRAGQRGVRGKKKVRPGNDDDDAIPFLPKIKIGGKGWPGDGDEDEAPAPRKRGRTARPNDDDN